MGAYLSQPNTEKYSSDHVNEILAVGASSMQGWRNSQEDAHNSILDFDKDTSFFAVYDGHGGAEVATYCAEKLPQFLKELETYKMGNFEQALKDAFLGFDQSLLEPHVVDLLKILAGEKNQECVEDMDEDDEEDLVALHEDGNTPLNEVIGRNYKGHPSMPALNKLQDLIGSSNVAQKPNSPFLRGRRAAAVAADNVNRAVLDPESKPAGSSTSAAAASISSWNGPGPSCSSSKTITAEPEDDSTVSSSSSNCSKPTSLKKSDVAEAEPSSSHTNGSSAIAANSDTTAHIKESEQNGSVTSSEAKIVPIHVCSSSVKSTSGGDTTVSGSNDKDQNKLNGNASSSDISSTSKAKEMKNFEDDSTDEDNEVENEDSILGETHRAMMECGSDDEDDEDADIADEVEDDEDDDVDDDDDDDEDDEADDEDDEDLDEDAEYADFYSNMIEEPGKDSGCTAVVSLLHGRDLYVANAGDSRCIVSRAGKAIEMSLDHKPEDEEESSRIVNAGGKVTLDGRVNGGLNLSRAIGDHAYKMNPDLPPELQMISALPDVRKLIVSPEDEFMVLACDGIWNFMSSEEVVEFVGKRISDPTKSLSKICEELFENCLAPNTMGDGTGCDNMTAVIVKFKPDLQKKPTKIDPSETEDVLAAKRSTERTTSTVVDEIDTSFNVIQSSLKRCASPTMCGVESADSNEAAEANKTKRLKTDDDKEAQDTPTVSSTPTLPTPATVSSVTASSNESSTTDNLNVNEVQQQNECDSGSAATSTTVSNEVEPINDGVSEVSST